MFEKNFGSRWFPLGLVFLILGLYVPVNFEPSPLVDIGAKCAIGLAVVFNVLGIFAAIKADRESR